MAMIIMVIRMGMRTVAAPEHYTDFAAVVDGEPPEAIFETGTASISCSSTFAGEIDVRIEADYSVTAVEQLMMVMVMMMVMMDGNDDGNDNDDDDGNVDGKGGWY